MSRTPNDFRRIDNTRSHSAKTRTRQRQLAVATKRFAQGAK